MCLETNTSRKQRELSFSNTKMNWMQQSIKKKLALEGTRTSLEMHYRSQENVWYLCIFVGKLENEL